MPPSPIELACYYSLSSPWAYLAGPKLQDIVRRHRVTLVLKPFDFQAVVPKTGGVPLRTRPGPRRSYHAEELDRWRNYLGMPLNLEPKHYPAAEWRAILGTGPARFCRPEVGYAMPPVTRCARKDESTWPPT